MSDMTFPPGCVRYGGLPSFLAARPMDYVQVKAIRKEITDSGQDFYDWAEWHYTWEMYAREVNHLPDVHAKALLTRLLMRDVGKDMELGLLGNTPVQIEEAEALPSIKMLDYLVAYQRLANRYAWYARACDKLPDPLHDPIPPLRVCPYAGSDVTKYFKPMINELIYRIGSSSVVELISNAILYVFGYLAERPNSFNEEIWQIALNGLFTEPFPLARWIMQPTDALNYVAVNYSGTGTAGFFPTPLVLAEFMGKIVGKDRLRDRGLPVDIDDGTLYQTIWEVVPEQETRMQMLTETVSDPCVGTGNMIWPAINDSVFGCFIDIVHNKVLTSRALCAIFTPWFTNSVFCMNALLCSGDETVNKIEKQRNVYQEEERAALLGFLEYACNLELDPEVVAARDHLQSEIRARGLARQTAKQMKPLQALSKLFSKSTSPIVQSAAVLVPTVEPKTVEFNEIHVPINLFDQLELIGKEKDD